MKILRKDHFSICALLVTGCKFALRLQYSMLVLIFMLNGTGCSRVKTKITVPPSPPPPTNFELVDLPYKNVWSDRNQSVQLDPSQFIHKYPKILSYQKPSSAVHKTQLHCHTNRVEQNASLSLNEIVSEYQCRGFHFISVTEHDRKDKNLPKDTPCDMLFEDPQIEGIACIPGEEGNKRFDDEDGKQHLLEIGLNNPDDCRPSGDFEVLKRTKYMHKIGGFTVAAHLGWKGEYHKDLYDSKWLTGIELMDTNDIEIDVRVWDDLLTADRMMWGYCTDDAHNLNSIGRGWVMFHSDSQNPTVEMALERLRSGDFYSVLLSGDTGAGWNPTGDWIPQMAPYQYVGGNLIFNFIGATKAELHFRKGLQTRVYNSLLPDTINTVNYEVKGNEGYVRLELFSEHGNRAFGQPVFVHGLPVEDSLPLNWVSATISGYFMIVKIVDNWAGTRLLFHQRSNAEKALQVIKAYKLDGQCFVGRPYGRMQYFTVSGQAPVGSQPGEDSISFDPARLEVRYTHLEPGIFPIYTPMEWAIVDQEGLIVEDFGDSEIMAYRGLEIIKKFGFTHRAVIEGEGEYGMVYYHK